MSIKEKVIKESIRRIENRSEKLNLMILSNPLADLIKTRWEAVEIIEKYKGDYKKIATLIAVLAKKEKKLFKFSESQSKNSNKWIDEKVKIDFELGQLKTELYYIKKNTGEL
tara:strand:+ start:297 stop:632 length:336 start_codon:yes stop_codon:yes gene_type:complete